MLEIINPVCFLLYNKNAYTVVFVGLYVFLFKLSCAKTVPVKQINLAHRISIVLYFVAGSGRAFSEPFTFIILRQLFVGAMSTRALRPKPVEIVEDDTWIWGNNRGGGGAPLKDIGGTPVANLRSVMKGSAQVDYSPSRSPIKTKSKHRAMSEEDDRYDIRESRKRREIDRGRDRDLSPDHGRARSPELVRGLENHYDAPIRHGRAIKDMHGTGPEKEARMRYICTASFIHLDIFRHFKSIAFRLVAAGKSLSTKLSFKNRSMKRRGVKKLRRGKKMR